MTPLEEVVGYLGSSVLMGAGMSTQIRQSAMAGCEHILNAIRPGIVRVSQLLEQAAASRKGDRRMCLIAKDFHRVNLDMYSAAIGFPSRIPDMKHIRKEIRTFLDNIESLSQVCETCGCPMEWTCQCPEACCDCVCGACGDRKLVCGEPCC